MAEGDRTTLKVAVAGIAATALVGIAGTAGALLSARNDRATQRELARDERTYDRRVSAYLDAIDFIEGQERTLEAFIVEAETTPLPRDPVIDRLRFEGPPGTSGRDLVPIRFTPPNRLTSRLGAFGSTEAFNAFQEGERLFRRIPLFRVQGERGQYIATSQMILNKRFVQRFKTFSAQIVRFRAIVHEEIG